MNNIWCWFMIDIPSYWIPRRLDLFTCLLDFCFIYFQTHFISNFPNSSLPLVRNLILIFIMYILIVRMNSVNFSALKKVTPIEICLKIFLLYFHVIYHQKRWLWSLQKRGYLLEEEQRAIILMRYSVLMLEEMLKKKMGCLM